MAMGFLGILGIVLLVFFFLIVAIILSVRSRQKNIDPVNNDEGGKKMIKMVYTYLILFATLMMTIGGSVASFMAVADLVSPPSYYMTYEDYKRGYVVPNVDPKQPQQKVEVKSEEELQNDYQLIVSQEKVRARERALNNLIKSFGWIVIPLPIFLYYQRRLKHE